MTVVSAYRALVSYITVFHLTVSVILYVQF